MYKFLKVTITASALMTSTVLFAQTPQTQEPNSVPPGYTLALPKNPIPSDFLLAVEKQKGISTAFQLQKLEIEQASAKQIATAQQKAQADADKLSPIIDDTIKKIKQENGWGDDVVFNGYTGVFIKKDPNTAPGTQPTVTPVKPAEAKPTAPKKK